MQLDSIFIMVIRFRGGTWYHLGASLATGFRDKSGCLQDRGLNQILTISLSIEQSKRLTLATELVARPGLLFLDEPNSVSRVSYFMS